MRFELLPRDQIAAGLNDMGIYLSNIVHERLIELVEGDGLSAPTLGRQREVIAKRAKELGLIFNDELPTIDRVGNHGCIVLKSGGKRAVLAKPQLAA
jgi:hypothetical protein